MAEPVEPRDVELIRRLAAGDEEAFLEFYRRYQGGLYRYAMHMSGSPEAAADVVQETFFTLIRHTNKFDEERGTPAAFLYGIARNHLRKLREREGRYVPLPDEFGNGLSAGWKAEPRGTNGNGHGPSSAVRSESVLESLEREETSGLLREAVLTLPQHYREPLTLCDLEGKSYTEAAALLQCPVGTVRSRLNRARSMLLDKLRPARMGSRAVETRPGERP
jgi:RNA polymerase sigma-70 factor (ECF subfamily)